MPAYQQNPKPLQLPLTVPSLVDIAGWIRDPGLCYQAKESIEARAKPFPATSHQKGSPGIELLSELRPFYDTQEVTGEGVTAFFQNPTGHGLEITNCNHAGC